MDDDSLWEVESAFFSNCLLLGYDASKTGTELTRHMFRHSNPKGGEAVLYFLLSCIRPQQIQKDFHGVWPIFDARQARDFRKVVQNLLAELEASKDLPRSNSRLSSLATCCGERFIELVWQLSAHALREVLLRMTPPGREQVPIRLTDVAQQAEFAPAVAPVTKARIALQRKKFLTAAAAAVERQDEWAGLADEITAEHRSLSAEQASLQQQLEHNRRSGSNGASSLEDEKDIHDRREKNVQRATQLWFTLMKHTDESRSMTSGHLQDVLTLREHRYRIDGAALREAMQSSRQSLPSENASGRSDEGARQGPNVRKSAAELLDVVDMLQGWTGALQASQQQLQQGDAVAPIIRDGEGSHGQALEAALAEHKKHLANLQALVTALKQQTPQSESTVDQLREQVADAMAESSQAGGLLSDPPFTPVRQPGGTLPAQAPESDPKSARLQLVPPTPAMKLEGRKRSGRSSPASLSPLGEDREGNDDQEERGGAQVETLTGRTRVGARMVGSLFEDEPSISGDSQNVNQLRRSIRQSLAARQEGGHVSGAAPMTASSRNQLFVTPAAGTQHPQMSRRALYQGSVVTGSSRPGVVARLDMDSGLRGERVTGGGAQSSMRSMPPPQDVTTGRLTDLRNRGQTGAAPLGRTQAYSVHKPTNDARGSSSSVAPGKSFSSAQASESYRPGQQQGRATSFHQPRQPPGGQSQSNYDFMELDQSSEYPGLDDGLGGGLDGPGFDRPMRGGRESSASRQSIPGWPAERILSPPLQVDVDSSNDDPDDVFDLLAPLKAQDLNFHSPRGEARSGRSSPSAQR